MFNFIKLKSILKLGAMSVIYCALCDFSHPTCLSIKHLRDAHNLTICPIRFFIKRNNAATDMAYL